MNFSALELFVPATTANLGPGFDALGLALDFGNVWHARVSPRQQWSLQFQGEGSASLALGSDNLVVRAALHAGQRVGLTVPPLELTCELRVPLSRGLGSSASAVVAGVILGSLFSGGAPDRQAWLRWATELEGHPDNAAPALFGGLQVSTLDGQHEPVSLRLPVPKFPAVLLFIPDFAMATAAARSVLPTEVSRSVAVHSLSRTALLLAALTTERWELLNLATEDRLHQVPRTQLFPALPKFLARAEEAGAQGRWLSGAGSTVAAFVPEEKLSAVQAAWEQTARDEGIAGRCVRTRVTPDGARWNAIP